MIDYDKLKLAHELAYKRCEHTGGRVDVTCCFFDTNIEPEYHFVDYTNDKDNQCFAIDDLLSKLQELTGELKAKYKDGQEVWYCWNHDVVDNLIVRVVVNEEIKYIVECGRVSMPESGIFSSRQALIEAQIEYWQSLKDKTPRAKFKDEIEGYNNSIEERIDILYGHSFNECQHESDGFIHEFNQAGEMGIWTMSKCIKCGEFYR